MNRNKRTRSGLLLRASMIILVMLCSAVWTIAQSMHQSSTEVERRVEALLGKMTLEEKITLIGGINDFYTRAIPVSYTHLTLPTNREV